MGYVILRMLISTHCVTILYVWCIYVLFILFYFYNMFNIIYNSRLLKLIYREDDSDEDEEDESNLLPFNAMQSSGEVSSRVWRYTGVITMLYNKGALEYILYYIIVQWRIIQKLLVTSLSDALFIFSIHHLCLYYYLKPY